MKYGGDGQTYHSSWFFVLVSAAAEKKAERIFASPLELLSACKKLVSERGRRWSLQRASMRF